MPPNLTDFLSKFELRDVVEFYATRDTNPDKWYPSGPDGAKLIWLLNDAPLSDQEALDALISMSKIRDSLNGGAAKSSNLTCRVANNVGVGLFTYHIELLHEPRDRDLLAGELLRDERTRRDGPPVEALGWYAAIYQPHDLSVWAGHSRLTIDTTVLKEIADVVKLRTAVVLIALRVFVSSAADWAALKTALWMVVNAPT